MPMLDPIRNYCERTGDHLWSEPVNALTNISFFIAAWLLWKQYKASGISDKPTATLITLIAIVGFGSTLFHTFANGLTMLADVIPIAAFTFYYLWHALRRLLGLNRIQATFLLLLFVGMARRMAALPHAYRFNGSADYFPCLAALLFISLLLTLRRNPASKPITIATGLFVISLTFRSIDFAVCASFPLGTHFLWHSINGVMLYYLTSAFIRRPSDAKSY